MLTGKKGQVVEIAGEHSLAYGCARHFRSGAAYLAITYLNEKAEPYVRPLATALGSEIIMPCDVTVAGQLEAVFSEISEKWGRFDFVLHSVAYQLDGHVPRGRFEGCLDPAPHEAKAITGNIAYVDAGYHVVG
jgi:enoyl-[acyl-carrier-protein] reductase (NADH)